MVTQAGFEPATPSFGGWCSKPLQVVAFTELFEMLRPSGFPYRGEASEE